MSESSQKRVCHPFDPVYDARSIILILGSMPSPKSRELNFFYMHPQNRMWTVLAAITGEPVPQGREERLQFLLRNRIAMWDTVANCFIRGAADSTIDKPVANDIRPILETASIRAIFTAGKKAHEVYTRHLEPLIGRPATCLPSTSPANRTIRLEQLIETYREALAAAGFPVVQPTAGAVQPPAGKED